MKKKTAIFLSAAALAVYFLIIFLKAAYFMPQSGVKLHAAPVESAEVLAGNDDEDYVPRELLPEERININTADAETLQRLPGIGPSLAEAIINYRSENGAFSRLEDIMEVKGIGQARFNDIANNITLEDGNNENTGS